MQNTRMPKGAACLRRSLKAAQIVSAKDAQGKNFAEAELFA